VTGKQGEITPKIDKSIDDVAPADFDAPIIPDGFSPDLLREDKRFVQFAKSLWTKRNLCFDCRGPQLLITAKTLEGRKTTGYKSTAVDMECAGANYKD
jgi:protease I